MARCLGSLRYPVFFMLTIERTNNPLNNITKGGCACFSTALPSVSPLFVYRLGLSQQNVVDLKVTTRWQQNRTIKRTSDAATLEAIWHTVTNIHCTPCYTYPVEGQIPPCPHWWTGQRTRLRAGQSCNNISEFTRFTSDTLTKERSRE